MYGALMTDKNIRHLPVLEHGAVLGMVSMRDVVRATLMPRRKPLSNW